MNTSKEITIYDIARELKLSAATVSRGLNNHPAINSETKKRITEMAKKMGYRSNLFASNLRRQRTQTLGVIIPKLNSHFVSSALAGIEKVANHAGYNLIISQSQESIKKEIANSITMFNSRVDGLIVSLSENTRNLAHFDRFFKRGIPVVFFDRVATTKYSAHVIIDNFKAGYEATSHLIAQGCSQIIHATGPLTSNVYVDRMQGYRQALSDHGLPFQEQNLIIKTLDEQGAENIARDILNRKPFPDGIFISNDNCAVVCLQALTQAGVDVPGDVAIVGFNNDLISRMVEPKLTTVNYPGEHMGEVVALNLVNHLEGVSPLTAKNAIIVHSELIIRGSSLRQNSAPIST